MGDASKYAGSMSQEAANINDTSAAKMEMFKNATQNAKAAIGDAFLPALGALAEALLPVINGIKQFAQENPTMVTAITGIVGGVLVLGTALGAIGLAVPLVTTALGGLTAIAGLVGTAIGAISLPVVAVVAAIAALVAAGVWLYNNWDMVKAKATEVWNAIPEYASQAWQWIQGVWSGVGAWFGGIWDSVSASVSSAFDSVVSAITSAWSGVSAWFGGIWDSVTASVSGAIDGVISTITGMASSISTAFANFSFESFVSGVIAEIEYAIMVALPAMWQNVTQSILSLFANAPAPVQEMVANILSIVGYAIDGLGLVFQGLLFVASTVWTGITTTVAVAVSVISAIWQTLASVASTVWAGITAVAQTVFNAVVSVWQGLVSAVSSAWQGVVSVATSVWDAVKSAVASAINAIRVVIIGVTSFFASAWQGIVGVATSVWNSVKSAVQSAINAIKPIITSVASFFSSAWNGLVSVAQSVWNGVKAAVSAGINGAKAVLTAGVTGFAIIFNAGFNAVKTVVSTVFNAIKALVRGDINGVKTAIQSGLSQLAGIARNAMSQMVSAVMSIGGRLRQAGSEIVQGLINGISAKMEAAVAKIREMASRMKNAVTGFFDINSPSRVMKQIGEWVSEGLALGVAAKAPLAAKEAKKLAEATKKAFDDEIKSLDRSILVNKLKLQGDPNAEFTADVVTGKYGDPTNKAALQPLFDKKQQELDLANQLKGLDEYNGKLADINRQIALVGNSSKVQEFLYDVEKGSNLTEKQVIGVVNALRNLEEAESRFKLDAEIQKSNDALERHLYLATQTADKYAAMRYDLAAQGFNQDQINHLVSNQQKTDAVNDFTSLQNSYNIETPAQKLEREYQEKLAVVTNYEQQIGDTVGAAVELRKQVEASYTQSVLEMEAKAYEQRISGYQAGLNQISGVWDKMTEVVKKSYGEQSTAAKVMFAGQQMIAVAQAIMNTELAATKAMAEGGFFLGIPMATAIRVAGYASAGIIAGQALAGFKTGGYTGDGGVSDVAGVVHGKEYVLNASATKRIGKDTLDRINSGGNVGGSVVNITIENYTSANIRQETDQNGDIRLIVGEELSKQLPQHVNNPNSEFNRSLKNNYQLQRRL